MALLQSFDVANFHQYPRQEVQRGFGSTQVNAHTVLRHRAAAPMNSGFTGRWDRNRTGALQLWSLLPFVQQPSTALGSTLGSNHPSRFSRFPLDHIAGRGSLVVLIRSHTISLSLILSSQKFFRALTDPANVLSGHSTSAQ